MIAVIKKGQIMLITKQNPNGGPALKGFPIEEDSDTGMLGYKLGYVKCGGCDKTETVLMRTVDTRQIVNKFGMSLDEYDQNLLKLKPKEPLRDRIIRFLGGRVE
jgi:hypothetical protein